MNKEKFIKIIELIGFKSNDSFKYDYEEYTILAFPEFYDFLVWGDEQDEAISYDDLENIKIYFEKELRSIKLKELLG